MMKKKVPLKFKPLGTWTVQSLTATQQRISDVNQRIAIVESKLIRLDTDIIVLSKRNAKDYEDE